MNSVKCSTCGFVGRGGFEGCKNCGAKFMQPNSELKTGLAIASLVIGVLNLFTLGFLGLGVILGITLAAVALSRAKHHPSVYGGKDFAISGLVVNIVSILLIVPMGIIAGITITNVLASRRAANEGSAIQALRNISAVQSIYVSGRRSYGTLEELRADGLISNEIAAGTRHGYVIRVNVSKSDSENPTGRFQVVAVPLKYPSSGRCSFFVDESAVIRSRDAHGKEATESDDQLMEGGCEDPSGELAPRRRAPVN